MPVNRPQPALPPTTASAGAADGRLYLRDQDLDQGAALIRAAARRLADLSGAGGAPASLVSAELDVVLEIHDRGPMDVGDLRRRLASPKQSMARNLNALEAKGLLVRETGQSDRRKRMVTLTAEGLALARQATERRRAALRSAFLTAGPEAVSGARRMLSELSRGDDRLKGG